MDAVDIVFWFCAVLNAGLSVVLIVLFRSRVLVGTLTERKAKAIYSALCLAIAAFCGIALFLSMTGLFKVSLGHGEMIVAAPVFNFLLACALIVAGRIVIGWVPIKW